jgi:hypothetical protein
MTNDNPPAPMWTCMDCQFGGAADSLCRNADGSHTFELLARAYLAEVDSDDDGTVADVRHRAFDCVSELVREAPAAAVGFLVVACAQSLTVSELCVIAAGPLEDVLCAHGPEVIAQLEKIAKVDPRFRLMLSGTWGRERIDPDVWARLAAAVSPGPVLDSDGRTPSAGTGAPVLTDADARVMFAPKSAAVAAASPPTSQRMH